MTSVAQLPGRSAAARSCTSMVTALLDPPTWTETCTAAPASTSMQTSMPAPARRAEPVTSRSMRSAASCSAFQAGDRRTDAWTICSNTPTSTSASGSLASSSSCEKVSDSSRRSASTSSSVAMRSARSDASMRSASPREKPENGVDTTSLRTATSHGLSCRQWHMPRYARPKSVRANGFEPCARTLRPASASRSPACANSARGSLHVTTASPAEARSHTTSATRPACANRPDGNAKRTSTPSGACSTPSPPSASCTVTSRGVQASKNRVARSAIGGAWATSTRVPGANTESARSDRSIVAWPASTRPRLPSKSS